MPKQITAGEVWPTLVLERLATWGKCVHAQRMGQRIRASDLCARVGISRTTLRRMEQGDPGVSAGAYLTTLLALGIGSYTMPSVPVELWQNVQGQRVRPRNKDKDGDDDYF